MESDYYSLSQGVPEKLGVTTGQVVDLTSKLRPDGSLAWTPPKGSWRMRLVDLSSPLLPQAVLDGYVPSR